MLRRTVVLIFVQGVTVSISLAAAVYVRLRLLSTGFDVDLFTAALPILLPIKLAAFAMSGSYRRWWYYSQPLDLFRMYAVNVVATCAAAAGIWLWAGPQFPRAIYLLDLALCFMLCVLVRYADQLAIGPRAPAVNRNETIQNGHPYPLWIPNLLFGLAFSLIAGVLFRLTETVVPKARLGTAFGLIATVKRPEPEPEGASPRGWKGG